MNKIKTIILQIGVFYAGLFWAVHAHATVIEFGKNGNIKQVHEAIDYVSKNRSPKFKSPVFIKRKSDLDPIILDASKKYGLHKNLIKAVISVESAYNIDAISPKGAQGLMQLMPTTAKRFGVKDSFDAKDNINGGAQYLNFLLKRFKGNIDLTLAAYNAGEGAVDKYDGIPPYPETIHYVEKVKATLDALD